jgi:hypothetical protein
MEEIEKLWQFHLASSFPEDVVGKDIEGKDLVSLDTSVAGCIMSFIDDYGSLKKGKRAVLLKCRESLQRVVPHLKGEANSYFSRLLKMSELALEESGENLLDGLHAKKEKRRKGKTWDEIQKEKSSKPLIVFSVLYFVVLVLACFEDCIPGSDIIYFICVLIAVLIIKFVSSVGV